MKNSKAINKCVNISVMLFSLQLVPLSDAFAQDQVDLPISISDCVFDNIKDMRERILETQKCTSLVKRAIADMEPIAERELALAKKNQETTELKKSRPASPNGPRTGPLGDYQEGLDEIAEGYQAAADLASNTKQNFAFKRTDNRQTVQPNKIPDTELPSIWMLSKSKQDNWVATIMFSAGPKRVMVGDQLGQNLIVTHIGEDGVSVSQNGINYILEPVAK